MKFNFDDQGWFDPNGTDPTRQTTITPQVTSGSPTIGQQWPCWSGDSWIMAEYFGPAVQPEPPTVPEDRKITRLAFLNRFTDAEAIALDLASIGTTIEAASIRRYMQKVNAATFIDLSRDDTIAGVRQLETVGLIGAGRADQILEAPITELERAK